MKKLKNKWSKLKRMGAYITKIGRTFPISLKDRKKTYLKFTKLKMTKYLKTVD